MPLLIGDDLGPFGNPSRHRHDQCHGHIGRVFGQHPRRICDRNTARKGRLHIDIVNAIAEIGDQTQIFSRLRQNSGIDPVSYGRHQNIGGPDGFQEI